MTPKVYLLTELRRLFNYYNIKYHYCNGNCIYLDRNQLLPPMKFCFDAELFYVSINHLPVTEFDPLHWKYTYMMPATSILMDCFKKLHRFNLIDDGTVNSIQQFERQRQSRYYTKRIGNKEFINHNTGLQRTG